MSTDADSRPAAVDTPPTGTPAPGAPPAATAGQTAAGAIVVYVGEPDEVHELRPGGPGLVFGRDPDACDVVIWSALNEPTLSRQAGRLWYADGQVWLRNLSRSHDLLVQEAGRPPEGPLPRRAHDADPGAARTLPAGPCLVLGPAGCELVVDAPSFAPAAVADDAAPAESTAVIPAVPAHLQDVAEALCAPLLAGGTLPATYAQIGGRLGTDSHKRVRLLVAELCGLYANGAAVADHAQARRSREERVVSALVGRPAHRVGPDGWRFDEAPRGGADAERRRALALPEYHEVAHLLVRHGLVAGPPATADGGSLPETA
jgi:hypothetical protein